MATHIVKPGATYSHPGTLKSTGTLIAQAGPPGEPGGVIEVATIGTNDGTIKLQGGGTGGGSGAALVVDGTGTNAGTITAGGGKGGHGAGAQGGTGASVTINGVATNAGRITLHSGQAGTGGGAAGTGATLIDNGSMANAGMIDLQGTGGSAASLIVASTGELTNSGRIIGTGSLVNDGLIRSGTSADPSGAINVAISGTGEIEIESGATLTLGNAVGAGQTVVFDGDGDRLNLSAPDMFAAPIDGFAGSDELNLTGLSYVAGSTSAIFSGGLLTVTDGSETDTFELLGVADGTMFMVEQDAVGGTLVEETAQCFVEGTRIATPAGELAVEDLAIGDLVLTVHGARKPIKWIGRRGYEGRFIAGNHLMLPVCIKADAIAPNVPRRDLQVSAGHALYIDGVLVPAWRLVNGVSVTQPHSVDSVTYFHVELEDHDLIFAEGTPAETYLDENARNQFANAAEYAALYPEDEPAGMPCMDRVEDGFVLAAIQRRINARAFIAEPAGLPGRLRGFVELAGPDRLVGWAQDEDNVDCPVVLDVIADSRRLLRILANRYRADVRAEGLGHGCHGFDLPLPAGLVTGRITVRRADDGALLPQNAGAATPRVARFA